MRASTANWSRLTHGCMPLTSNCMHPSTVNNEHDATFYLL